MRNKKVKKAYHLTVCLLVGVGILLSVILFLTYPILLQLLGARGEVLMQAEAYVQIIILGCVFQIIGSGMIPLLRNRGMAVSAMVSMVTGMFVNLALNYVFIFKSGAGNSGSCSWHDCSADIRDFYLHYLIYIKGKTKVQLVWKLEKEV